MRPCNLRIQVDAPKPEAVDEQFYATIGISFPLPIELRIVSVDVDEAEDVYLIKWKAALPNGFGEPPEGEPKQYLVGDMQIGRREFCLYGDGLQEVRTPEEAVKNLCEILAEATARDVSEFMIVGANHLKETGR